jgi:uncharacterized protein YgiM (DUF1202 family)
MNVKINENVGIILAQMEASITADQIRDDLENSGPGNEEHPVSNSLLLARATDVVNIRSSDSETADRVDRAIVGQEFTVLEQRANGWSRISYQGGDAYIKSEFLEIIGELGDPSASAANATVIGKIVARDSVRIRATPSTNGDVLGTLPMGGKLDLVEQMNGGWSKVIYNGNIAYVKSDYVRVE